MSLKTWSNTACATEFTLRFIETMPLGDAGRHASEHYLDLQYVPDKPGQRCDLIPGVVAGGGPARYFKIRGTDVNIGFITPDFAAFLRNLHQGAIIRGRYLVPVSRTGTCRQSAPDAA